MRNEEFIPTYFRAVACDIHGAQLAGYGKSDCIDNVLDEALDIWDGWDEMYTIQVYRITHDLDGNMESECVHEEYVKPQVILD